MTSLMLGQLSEICKVKTKPYLEFSSQRAQEPARAAGPTREFLCSSGGKEKKNRPSKLQTIERCFYFNEEPLSTGT